MKPSLELIFVTVLEVISLLEKVIFHLKMLLSSYALVGDIYWLK